MWGWGSLSANAIILFAESLANKVEIPDEKAQLITVRGVISCLDFVSFFFTFYFLFLILFLFLVLVSL
jgi:hypothetical protein